jgi:signal transduction protein with GAF and PtsI domain
VPKIVKKQIDELTVFSDLCRLFSSSQELHTILQETIHVVSHLTKADACFLYLYDSVNSELVLSASKTPHPNEIGHLRLKLGQGITGWVAKNLKAVSLAKGAHKDPRFFGTLREDRFEAFLSIPILIKEKLVAVINAQHKKPMAHSERLITLLEAIGRQVGTAIVSSHLSEETQKRGRALEALTAVSSTLAQEHYPEEVMQHIVNMTAQMMGSNICSIQLLDEKKMELRVVAAQALDPDYRNKPPVKVNGSITGKAVLTKQPIVIKDVRKEASYQFRDLAVRQGLVSLLCVPMMYKSKVMGVLNNYKPVEHTFSADEVSVAKSVANQCAAAIENTRLLSEKLAAQDALETRKVVERAKGLLMKNRQLSEPEAFREIQRRSMDHRKTMKEISEAIILAEEIRAPAS